MAKRRQCSNKAYLMEIGSSLRNINLPIEALVPVSKVFHIESRNRPVAVWGQVTNLLPELWGTTLQYLKCSSSANV